MPSPRDWQKIIGNLFLTVTYISALTCLLRSDYNFPFCLFMYYIWTLKPDLDSNKLLMVTTGILIFVDIIWLCSVGPIWTTRLANNEIWNSFHGAHVFNIFLSSVSVFVKLGIVGGLFLLRGQKDEQLIIARNEAFQGI